MIYRRSDWFFERTQSRALASVPWDQPTTRYRLFLRSKQGVATADYALIIAVIAASAAALISVWGGIVGIY